MTFYHMVQKQLSLNLRNVTSCSVVALNCFSLGVIIVFHGSIIPKLNVDILSADVTVAFDVYTYK